MTEEYVAKEVLDVVRKMLLPLSGLSVLGIAAALLLAFCVYNDARGRRDKLAVMWGVLSGFFNIAALVYVIIRCASNPKPSPCIRCGAWVPPGALFCTSCGQPLLDASGRPVSQEQLDGYHRRSKTLLIAWICVYAVCLAASIITVVYMVNEILDLAQSSLYW